MTRRQPLETMPGAVEGWNVLPPLAPDQSARALAVNDSGQIVGLAVVDNIHRRAVRWVVRPNGPAVADLGTLRADGSGDSLASDINDLGQIAGFAQDESGSRKPFFYLPSPAYGLPVGMHNLMPDLDVRIGKTTLVTGHGRRDDITDINGFPASHGFVLSVTCTGDLDDDGDVDQDDQKILMSYFGEEVPPGTDADLNHDGVVDDADIRLLARQMERPCL